MDDAKDRRRYGIIETRPEARRQQLKREQERACLHNLTLKTNSGFLWHRIHWLWTKTTVAGCPEWAVFRPAQRRGFPPNFIEI
jgi:hypothetical protein